MHSNRNTGYPHNNRLVAANFRAFAVALVVAASAWSGLAAAQVDKYAPPAESALPPSDMKLDLKRVALVVTDPQIDFLSPEGVTWTPNSPG